jgi:hypothetical protein
MRTITILISILIFFNYNLNGQIKTIQGIVISEDLESLPMVRIQSLDTVVIGETDINGHFVITIPQKTDKLLLSFVGMEWTIIQMPIDCDSLEIIMMYDAHYDFMTSNKIDRLRKRRFEKLPELRQLAFRQGLFKRETSCFKQEFVPYKPQLEEIKKRKEKKPSA